MTEATEQIQQAPAQTAADRSDFEKAVLADLGINTEQTLTRESTPPIEIPPMQKPGVSQETPPEDVIETQKETTPDQDEDEDLISAFKPKKKEASKKEIETPTELKDTLKSAFGVDDLNTLKKSADKWRKDSIEYSKVKTEYEDIKGLITNLPPEIKSAIDAYAKQEDYTAAFNKNITRVDYSKPFEENDITKLVKEYFPDENVTDPDGMDYIDLSDKYSKEAKILKSTAKDKFNLLQEKNIEKQNAENSRIRNQKEAYEGTVKSSIDLLKKSIPEELKQNRISEIDKLLTSGNLGPVFFDKGGLREDAAERAFYALNGKKIIKALQSALNEQSETVQQTIAKGGESPRRKGGQAGDETAPMSEWHRQVLSDL